MPCVTITRTRSTDYNVMALNFCPSKHVTNVTHLSQYFFYCIYYSLHLIQMWQEMPNCLAVAGKNYKHYTTACNKLTSLYFSSTYLTHSMFSYAYPEQKMLTGWQESSQSVETQAPKVSASAWNKLPDKQKLKVLVIVVLERCGAPNRLEERSDHQAAKERKP